MPDWPREYFERGYAQRWGLKAPDPRVRLEAGAIWTMLRLSPGASIVDVGCGHGRHAIALAERGASVVGIDFADSLLRRARQLTPESEPRPHWIRGDMRMLPLRDGCADAVLITDSFGFFETDAEHVAVVTEARRILRHAGSLVLKVVNGAPILANLRESEQEERDGVEVTVSTTLAMEPPRMIQRLSVRGSRGEGNYERRQRLFRGEELRAMLEHVGFSVTGLFENPDGEAFDSERSPTIWLVGRRRD